MNKAQFFCLASGLLRHSFSRTLASLPLRHSFFTGHWPLPRQSFSGLWPHHLRTGFFWSFAIFWGQFFWSLATSLETVFLVSGHITWGQFFWSLTSAYPRDRLCLRPRLTGSIPPDFLDILHKQFPAFIGSYRNSSICIVLETIQ